MNAPDPETGLLVGQEYVVANLERGASELAFNVGDVVTLRRSNVDDDGEVYAVNQNGKHSYVLPSCLAYVEGEVEVEQDESPEIVVGGQYIVGTPRRHDGHLSTRFSEGDLVHVVTGLDSDGEYEVESNDGGSYGFLMPSSLLAIEVEEDFDTEDTDEWETVLPAYGDLPLDYAMGLIKYFQSHIQP